MFRFIVLLSSLARVADITKCLLLNYETCMVRPTLIDMNSECDGIIIVMDIVSTKNTNTIATNVTSTASINWHSKEVRDCYILHTVLLAIILILIITIICYHYAKQKGII